LPFKRFEKLHPIFLDAELNRNKSEIDKWDMEINELIEHKYKDDPWITNVIKAIQTGKRQYKNITLAKYEIHNNQLYY
jgi:hypothetical protein